MNNHTASQPNPGGDDERGASRGQVIIMFALFASAMFGVLGLAIDLGMSFAERRTMQNAADLGAIAGARAVARYTSSSPTSALSDVTTIVQGNRMNNAPTLNTCEYVDDYGSSVGSCNVTVPASAVGVSVTVSETHPTFFIRVIPGAPANVTTSATARAQVERLYRAGMDGPFIVCGYTSMLESGGSIDILTNDNTVNPAAIGKTFEVHGPKIGTGSGQGGDCGIASSSFKGLAEQDSNNGKELGEYWYGDTGVHAGPTRFKVEGIEGCAKDTPDPYGCILFLPVSSNSAHGHPAVKSGSQRKFWVVKVLAFRISSCGANCHQGTLIDDYLSYGGAVPGWSRDSGGVAVVRLTE
jgi:Flp pilus assembly protein TadG